jgi:plastocyanin
LFPDGLVHAFAKDLFHFCQLRLHALAHRAPFYDTTPVPGLPANTREAQKVERSRFGPSATAPSSIRFATEGQEPRFLRVQFQSELRKSVAQFEQKLLGIFPMLKPDHEVVRKTHRDPTPAVASLQRLKSRAQSLGTTTWCRSEVNRCFGSLCAAFRIRWRVALRFTNTDAAAHNVVVIESGQNQQQIGALLNAYVSDASAAGRDFIPPRLRTLAASPMVSPRQSATVTFTVPDVPGDYPFVCSVPGHWVTMWGVIRVVM